MNISKKLKLSFASAIALPLIIIAVLVITQLRQQALDNFAELSEREARQVDNGISMFFDEIEKNVDYLASHSAILDAEQGVKTHMQSPNSVKLDHAMAVTQKKPHLTYLIILAKPIQALLTSTWGTSKVVIFNGQRVK